ncbi:hypothetical protein E2C01_098533 [Portunus trituberculatus]|uniref:Uncharacterized protein n=1 Tax=Portunus trituberculatus TaxID=210409 RepID=A0A5B7K8I1_PORTR|nr:hypothetical protein [Portunus trituberculatus]
MIQENLSPEKHISKIFGRSYKMLTNIRVASQYMDKDMMKKIITSMIPPRLKYAAVDIRKFGKDTEDCYKDGAGIKGPNI